MARLVPLALALLLSGCGVSPSPVIPAPVEAPTQDLDAGGGGGSAGDETEPVLAPFEPDAPAPVVSSAPLAVIPSPAPSSAATPRPDDDDEDDGPVSAAPSPTPTPVVTTAPSASPTPTPSTTPTAQVRGLVVDASQHTIAFTSTAYVGGPLVVSKIEKTAWDNANNQHPFRALAGIDIGRYGWTYKRIETVADANDWSGDVGNPGPVCFLDSVDGLADNSGSWKVYQSAGDQADDQEISAAEHVTRWNPSAVAYTDLGAEKTWTVSLENIRGGDQQYAFPGVFLIYSHPDGGRDFRIVTGQPQTLRTRGYVYAFYMNDGFNTPDQADRVVFR